MAKLPFPPPARRLRDIGTELAVLERGTVCWRVHATTGHHARGWNELRRYGPVASCRFDPHVPPPRVQNAAVAYLATDVATALAECFQTTRVVDTRSGSPHLSGFGAARDLRLLDLTGTWPLRAGASHAINTGRRDVCRLWSQTIVEAWPGLEGLLHTSSMTGRRCVTLFGPGSGAFPPRPGFSAPMSDPGLHPWLASACGEIGYLLA